MAPELKIKNNDNSFKFCKCCPLEKLQQLPFFRIVIISENILEMINIDIWSPTPEKSLYGLQYFTTIMDDFSRYIWSIPIITSKSDKSLKIDVKKLTSKMDKSSLSDSATKNIGHT